MIKVKVFLICLSVVIVVFSLIVCIETYTLERAIARGVYTEIADDMQDIGYLHVGLADYYRKKMLEVGWEEVDADFYKGSWPREETLRARKERNEMITLTLTIRPTRLSQWINFFLEGETVFRFSGRRASEYFDPGW